MPPRGGAGSASRSSLASLLISRRVIGAPVVTPWYVPESMMTRSVSSFCRLPRPYPPWRRSSSRSMNALSISTPEGKPSTMAVRAGPCDSPAVR